MLLLLLLVVVVFKSSLFMRLSVRLNILKHVQGWNWTDQRREPIWPFESSTSYGCTQYSYDPFRPRRALPSPLTSVATYPMPAQPQAAPVYRYYNSVLPSSWEDRWETTTPSEVSTSTMNELQTTIWNRQDRCICETLTTWLRWRLEQLRGQWSDYSFWWSVDQNWQTPITSEMPVGDWPL